LCKCAHDKPIRTEALKPEGHVNWPQILVSASEFGWSEKAGVVPIEVMPVHLVMSSKKIPSYEGKRICCNEA
jgi:hypothetical protein